MLACRAEHEIPVQPVRALFRKNTAGYFECLFTGIRFL